MKFTITKSKCLIVITMTLAFFILPIFSQVNQPQARKFDEFSDTASHRYANYFGKNYEEERKEFEMRIARYIRQLRLEKSRAYIIGYGGRVNPYRGNDYSVGESLARNIQNNLPYPSFDAKNTEILDGGIRENETTELWIVPPGASVPKATPTFKKEDTVCCPRVYIKSESYLPNLTCPLEFFADVSSNDSKITPVYDWQIENGKIISGQGSQTIQVEPTNKSGTVTAKVNLKGFSLDCADGELTNTGQTVFGVPQYKLDEFDRAQNGDIKARLDSFAVALQNDPLLQGYIVNYQGRTDPKASVERRKVLIQIYLFRSRGIASERIIFVDGGFRETISSELWVAVAGSGLPPLTPTVDKKYATAK